MALYADRSGVTVVLAVCCMPTSAWIDAIGNGVAVECIDRTPTSSRVRLDDVSKSQSASQKANTFEP